MFEWITNPLADAYNATFGEMSGKEVLWTVIGLLCLYQLVMIKWRLIDQARANQTPSSFWAGQRRLAGQVISPRRSRIMADDPRDLMASGTPFDSSLNQNDNPFQAVQHDDRAIKDLVSAASEPMSAPSNDGMIMSLDGVNLVGSTHKSSSQAGLQTHIMRMTPGRTDLDDFGLGSFGSSSRSSQEN